MVDLSGDQVVPRVSAILNTPPLTTRFRNENPVKFLANQILHLVDVTEVVEEHVLDIATLSPPTRLNSIKAQA